ncbi:MAG: beta-ketoacyl-[acyl-carrier-protein] synthase family protein [Chthoniobacteraceae bacterium]
MSQPVAIVAAGVVSPLGRGADATARALRDGVDCVSPVTAFDVSSARCRTAGQVPDAWLEDLRDSRERRRFHRASLMMIAACRELRAQDAAFSPEQVVIGATGGGMTFGEAFYRALVNGAPDRRRAAWLANYNPQKPVLDAQEDAGFRAPSAIIANACASGSNAIGHAFDLISRGRRKAVLCGGYDAISELVFRGFDCLQASTPEKIRPFDAARTGLVLGEGAALFALENLDDARARGARILGLVTGYGISTDTWHITQPHPSGIGPRLAMERALASAGRASEEIDYINAHGTATTFNDATEGLAISQLFGSRVPVSSTKSMMGHALGGAGAIEAVISLIALREGFLPPNINFTRCDSAWDLNIVANQSRPAAIRRVVSNSFGFGGTNASLVIESL